MFTVNESDGVGALEDLLRNRHRCRAFLPWQVLVTSGGATDRFRKALVDQLREGREKPDFDFPLEYTGIYRAK